MLNITEKSVRSCDYHHTCAFNGRLSTKFVAIALLLCALSTPAFAASATGWSWIWSPDGSKPPETLYFRQNFNLAAKPSSAFLYITAEDGFKAYLNGIKSPVGAAQDWSLVHRYRVTQYLRKGANLLAIEAENQSLNGGLIYDLKMTFGSGDVVDVVSGPGVLVNRNPPLVWTKLGLNVKHWSPAHVVAPAGGAPWGPLRGALLTDDSQLVRVWNLAAGGTAGQSLYTRPRNIGDRMIMETSIADPDTLRILRSEGFTLYQTDCDHLAGEEKGPGRWDWSNANTDLTAVKTLGEDWAYAEQENFPSAWYRSTHKFTPLMCTEDHRPVDAFSFWSSSWPDYVQNGYKALAKEFGPVTTSTGTSPAKVSALLVGVGGEFGDVGYMTGLRVENPLQRADWIRRFGNAHDHLGWWCDDPDAHLAFQRAVMQEYGSLDAVNKAWSTNYTSQDEITYPADLKTEPDLKDRAHYLDFINWYRAAAGKAEEMNLAAARKYFPDTLLMVSAGFPDENLRGGNDNSLIPKLAARLGAGVRSSHGGYKPFADNAATMFGRLGSACRFYGAPFWSTPSGSTTADQTVQRIYEAVSQGATGYFDWAYNASSPANSNVYYLYSRFLRVDKPITDVAMFYPALAQEIRPEQGYNRLFARECARLRDLADYDIVDDRMVDDGCLNGYRVLVLWQGTICTPATLAIIKQWVNNGGVLVAYDFGKVTTFSGDTSWFKDLFGYVQNLNPAEVSERYVGTLPDSYSLAVGNPNVTPYLSGSWQDPDVSGTDIRRWTGASAAIKLPLMSGSRYELSVRATIPQEAASLKHEVLLDGVKLGDLDAVGDVRYRFIIPRTLLMGSSGVSVHVLTFTSETFTPAAGSSESKAGAPLGVHVEEVTVSKPGISPSADAPPGVLQQRLNLSLLTSSQSDQSWVRRYGKGLTIYFPATRRLMRGYLAVLNQVIYHLSEIDPDMRDALPIDGESDGVYATLFPDKILYFNSTDQTVTEHVAITPAEFSAWKGTVDTPSVNSWTLVMAPHSIHGIYFKPAPQELLYQCEGFTNPGGLKPEDSADCSPGSGPTCIWMGGGKEISTLFDASEPGTYNVFLRCLHGKALVPVDVLVDGQPVPQNSVHQVGAVLNIGQVTLTAGRHTLSLRTASNQAVRADFVLLSNDPDVSGYRFALKALNLPGTVPTAQIGKQR